MLIFRCILIFICIFIGQTGYSQNLPTINSVIARHAQAMGGKTAWKQLKSFRILLQNNAPNLTFLETRLMKRPKCFQIILDMPDPNLNLIKSFDGLNGWIAGNGTSKKMNPEAFAKIVQESELYDGLLLSLERNYPTELLGQDTSKNGALCYKIRMKQRDYFVNSQTYLLEQISEYTQTKTLDNEILTTTFADYKTTEKGLVFPYQQQFFTNNTWTLTSTIQTLELNVLMATRIFQQPSR